MNRGGNTTPDSKRELKAAAVLKELCDLNAKVFFEKVLTASDTSGSKSGRVVIPKVNLTVNSDAKTSACMTRDLAQDSIM